MLLVGAPCELRLLAGQERGRTIPLTDLRAVRGFQSPGLCYRWDMSDALPAAANPESLTDALRRSGVLNRGRVCNVVVESSRNTILLRIIRLRLTYDDAGDDAPSSLIFKTGIPDRAGSGWNPGRQEVAFYAQAGSVMTVTPGTSLLRCLLA